MKIKDRSTERLHIRHLPWACWLIGLLLTLFGLCALLGFGQVVTLECERHGSEPGCVFERKGVFGSKHRTFQIEQLVEARVATRIDSDGDPSYQVVMQVDDETFPFPFTFYSSSQQRDHADIARDINQFIENHDAPSLLVSRDGRRFAYPIGGGLLLSGFFLALWAGRVVNVVFDRSSRKLTIRRRTLFGTRFEQYWLDQVQGAEVEEKVQSRDYTYRATILLANGRKVPVTKRFGSREHDAETIVKAIRHFISHGRPEEALD